MRSSPTVDGSNISPHKNVCFKTVAREYNCQSGHIVFLRVLEPSMQLAKLHQGSSIGDVTLYGHLVLQHFFGWIKGTGSALYTIQARFWEYKAHFDNTAQ